MRVCHDAYTECSICAGCHRSQQPLPLLLASGWLCVLTGVVLDAHRTGLSFPYQFWLLIEIGCLFFALLWASPQLAVSRVGILSSGSIPDPQVSSLI